MDREAQRIRDREARAINEEYRAARRFRMQEEAEEAA